VNGHGIPIKYWGEFFKKLKTRSKNSAWDSIKVEWGNWKVSGEHDCAELMGSTQFLVYCRGTAVLSKR
jgi:hypothetical protein